MKIVHTSDWHIGRRWKGIQRLDELEAVLDRLAGFIEREVIDLVLHSRRRLREPQPAGRGGAAGRNGSWSAWRSGARMVVIAGHHDRSGWMPVRCSRADRRRDPWPPPLGLAGGVRTSRPLRRAAVVAALPFASPGAWVSALDIAGEEAKARDRYARMFAPPSATSAAPPGRTPSIS